MEEIWKAVKGYEGLYEVSNLGNVKSLDHIIKIKSKNQHKTFEVDKLIKGKKIKKSINSNGYYQICLYKDGKKKNKLVHRIETEAFKDNPENKKTVNHIDGNRLNNKLWNLEWATMQEQQYHSFNVLNHRRYISELCRKRQKELHQRKVKRSDGVIFNSIKEASNDNKNLAKSISKCCNNKLKTADGYKWEYIL